MAADESETLSPVVHWAAGLRHASAATSVSTNATWPGLAAKLLAAALPIGTAD